MVLMSAFFISLGYKSRTDLEVVADGYWFDRVTTQHRDEAKREGTARSKQ